ncbi:MAG: lamin tail domain-containing protein [Prevotellaceae bacterium]|jgi:hypothetical protein|nr:lamin tail domain-containing protein [Prevotellaceae bacterium]
MNKKILWATVVAAALLSSCKTDTEDDLKQMTSNVQGLYINEVFTSNPDWVELYNSSDAKMDLGGFVLQDDKGAAEEYIIPAGTVIDGKSFLVIDAFAFGLSSTNGDKVTLFDKQSGKIDEVIIPVISDGKSYARSTDGGNAWVLVPPTKGISNTDQAPAEPTNTTLKLYINEVVSAPAGTDADWIELYNAGDTEINIGGFILQDDKGAAEEYIIPANTTIAAKGFIVFENGSSFQFGLGSKGDKVILLDAERVKIDDISTPNFGEDKGKSYARIPNGSENWQTVNNPTKGMSN